MYIYVIEELVICQRILSHVTWVNFTFVSGRPSVSFPEGIDLSSVTGISLVMRSSLKHRYSTILL